MIAHLNPILGALVPLFGLILAGTALARINFPGGDFWPALERFIYFVLFPALLIEGLATADLDAERIQPVLMAAAALLGIGSLGLFLLKAVLRIKGPAFSAFYQGGIRFNTYLGIAVVLSVFGDSMVAVTALTMALMIPLINLGCVLVLAVYGQNGGKGQTIGRVIGQLATNPLILGCLVGLGLNLGGIRLQPWLAEGMAIAGGAAIPLGLMSVGAGLQFSQLAHNPLILLVSSLVKLLAMPALAWWMAGMMALDTAETRALVVFAALPMATSAYILARQMGGDHGLVARLLTLQTAAAALTLPLVLSMLASQGG